MLHRLLAHYCNPAEMALADPSPAYGGSAIQAALAAMAPDMLLALREVARTQSLGDMAGAYAARRADPLTPSPRPPDATAPRRAGAPAGPRP